MSVRQCLKTSRKSLIFLVPVMLALMVLALHVSATSAATQEPTTDAGGTKLYGLIAASLAVGLSGLAAGIAIFGTTSAGMAATAERPELTTWVLILAGLGEGLAIYGLVVAIMILGKI